MVREIKNHVIAFYPISKLDRNEFDYCDVNEIMDVLATIKDEVVLAQFRGTWFHANEFVDLFNDGEDGLSEDEKDNILTAIRRMVNIVGNDNAALEFINSNWAIELDIDLNTAVDTIKFGNSPKHNEQASANNSVSITSTEQVNGTLIANVILNELISITKNGKVPVMIEKGEHDSYILRYGENNKKTFMEHKIILS